MKDIIKGIVIALVIVFLVTLVIKPTIVKETSMEPTLYENDYLILYKLAYKTGDVKRGDIIVFRSDMEGSENLIGMGQGKKLLIKRIIGLPGDVINIKDGDLYVNGKLQKEDYIAPGGTSGFVEDETVEKGKVFVLGDHREVSLDSRYEEVGQVDQDRIVGKAVVRLFPFNKIRTF